MVLDDVVLIGARTARTNAYAQALKNRGIYFGKAILFGGLKKTKPGQPEYVPENKWHDSPVFLPDFSCSVDEVVERIADEVIKISGEHVNEDSMSEALDQMSPSMIVYSGYGSQIVGEHILNKAPVLHIHSGWLPDFRGSTTTYYHLLKTGDCGVSALFLAKDIDEGPIIARKRYPKPPYEINIDYIYDSAIRADLLCDVLLEYGKHKVFPNKIQQEKDEGNTYYIIHPVLKHIAILSLEHENLKLDV